MIIRVATNFGRLSDTELDNFAQGVIDALTGNATYPTPPVTLANLQAAVDDYTAKMAAAQTGGVADTAAKNNSRNTLEEMLRKVAAYVQMMCNEDPVLLLSSGFQMQSTNRTSTPLEKPIEGLSPGPHTVRVVAEGRAPHPDLRLRLAYQDWVDIVGERLDPRRAVLTGKLRPRGNPLAFRRLARVFPQD